MEAWRKGCCPWGGGTRAFAESSSFCGKTFLTGLFKRTFLFSFSLKFGFSDPHSTNYGKILIDYFILLVNKINFSASVNLSAVAINFKKTILDQQFLLFKIWKYLLSRYGWVTCKRFSSWVKLNLGKLRSHNLSPGAGRITVIETQWSKLSIQGIKFW